MKKFDIDKVYNIYIGLSKKQRKDLIVQLNRNNLFVTKIVAYTYSDAPGIKHLFFYFKGNNNPIAYFLLEEELLEKIQEYIFSFVE